MAGLRRIEWFAISVTVAVVAPVLAMAPAQGSQSDRDDDDDDRQPKVFIEVSPDTVAPGGQVKIFASCGEKVDRAEARSRAFDDDVALLPEPGSNLLSGSVIVPTTTAPDTYPVNLRCPNAIVATVDLHVVTGARPTVGPATGGGGTAQAGDLATDLAVNLAVVTAGVLALVAGGALLVRGRHRAGRPPA